MSSTWKDRVITGLIAAVVTIVLVRLAMFVPMGSTAVASGEAASTYEIISARMHSLMWTSFKMGGTGAWAFKWPVLFALILGIVRLAMKQAGEKVPWGGSGSAPFLAAIAVLGVLGLAGFGQVGLALFSLCTVVLMAALPWTLGQLALFAACVGVLGNVRVATFILVGLDFITNTRASVAHVSGGLNLMLSDALFWFACAGALYLLSFVGGRTSEQS